MSEKTAFCGVGCSGNAHCSQCHALAGNALRRAMGRRFCGKPPEPASPHVCNVPAAIERRACKR
jgi:hypothetical protein